MYTFSDRVESWFWLSTSFVTLWLPIVYAGFMAGLAIWLMRHQPMPGLRWLAAGYGLKAAANAVIYIVQAIAFPDYMVEGEFGKTFPTWVFTISSVTGIVRFACYFVIAFGFWKLCEHLVGNARIRAQQPADLV